MRKNKREIPPEFLSKRNREVNSSLYGFDRDITLLSYVPKKNQSVVMISTRHHDAALNPQTHKLEIIGFYNKTKGGMDPLDKKCANYSVRRRAQRWPCAIFAAILNISASNGFILLIGSNSEKKIRRQQYIKEIGLELVRHIFLKENLNMISFLRSNNKIQNR